MAPGATMIRGATAAISASSQGKQASISTARLAVDAPRSARHPFEILDDVGDVGPRSIDPGFGEATVEQLSRRPDKRVAGKVLRIPRLLADQHHKRPLGTLTEHRLGSISI